MNEQPSLAAVVLHDGNAAQIYRLERIFTADGARVLPRSAATSVDCTSEAGDRLNTLESL